MLFSLAWLLAFWYFSGLLLAVLYFFIIRRLRWHWNKVPVWHIPKDFRPELRISVLIPARNEEARLGACLKSVLDQSYPASLYEVIVIDDHSTDGTAELVRSFASPQLRLLHLKDFLNGKEAAAHKKKALEAGVAYAVGELIVTTDADCEVPRDWLMYFASCYQERRPVLIAAPVGFHRERHFLQSFQSLDFLGMMLLTGGGLHSGRLLSANGANLAYEREAFLIAGGYGGVDHVASGDDLFLLHKLAGRYPQRLFFLRAAPAVVHTEACADLPSFFRQRLRWATKSAGAGLRGSLNTPMLAMVFLLCWAILVTPLMVLAGGVPALLFGFLLLMGKSVTDYGLLKEAAVFFRRGELMRFFWPSQAAHVVYVATIGLAANLVRRYEWKGRVLK